jgi:23S rRNA pseudouridine1911/1915/1917 synthase
VLSILYEDAHLLAVDKPAGLSTQAPPIAGPTLETAVRSYLRPDDPASAYVGLVHRLDRPVSGVILFAKTARDAKRLSAQFARRVTNKEYWAVVEGHPGWPPGDEVTWEDWLCREDTGLGRVQTCLPGTPRGQEARTRARIVPGDDSVRLPEACAWLRLRPETGRMHQLRVQAASRGLPILGDRLYGSARPFREGVIALHARSLTVRHPSLDRPITFQAPIPCAWAEQGIALGESAEPG